MPPRVAETSDEKRGLRAIPDDQPLVHLKLALLESPPLRHFRINIARPPTTNAPHKKSQRLENFDESDDGETNFYRIQLVPTRYNKQQSTGNNVAEPFTQSFSR